MAHYTGTVPISPEVYKEVVRLLAIFEFARQQTRSEGVEGGYLFGEFGIADAFFWPILWVCRCFFFFLLPCLWYEVADAA